LHCAGGLYHKRVGTVSYLHGFLLKLVNVEFARGGAEARAGRAGR
jgi:hypothetical protein